MSTYVDRSLYALVTQFRNWQIHIWTKQDPQLWKYGHVLFSTNKTRFWNRKLSHNKQSKENRLLQSWRLFFTATLCFKLWVASTTFVPVKKCVHLSLRRVSNVAVNRKSSMRWDDTIYKKKASRLLKFGSANGGDCTKQPTLLNNISENTFLTGVHLQLNNF